MLGKKDTAIGLVLSALIILPLMALITVVEVIRFSINLITASCLCCPSIICLLFDFKSYIEICPLYGKNEKYTLKMDKKKQVFGCILLKNEFDFDHFLNELVKQKCK